MVKVTISRGQALLVSSASLAYVAACGGGGAGTSSAQTPSVEQRPTEAEVTQAVKPCGEADKVRTHDLNSETATEGVSVGVTPANNRLAACIDRAARKLSFPSSDRLDVVHQKF